MSNLDKILIGVGVAASATAAIAGGYLVGRFVSRRREEELRIEISNREAELVRRNNELEERVECLEALKKSMEEYLKKTKVQLRRLIEEKKRKEYRYEVLVL